MRKLALIAALLLTLTGCPQPEHQKPPPRPTNQVLACYIDGRMTLRVIGHSMEMHRSNDMVEVWAIQVITMNGGWWYTHRALPEEQCGPEPQPPPMVD